MPINLYSKDSVDSLLAAKLSDAPIDGSTYGRNNGAWAVVSGGGLTISTLSNAATATLNATVPTAGQALTYDGTDLIWATVSGGVAWGAITGTLSAQTDLQSELNLKANLSAPSFTSGISVDASGITFSDSTTQTTAAIAGANFGDAFTLGKVQDVSISSGYWIITFAPVNSQVMASGLSVSLSNGSSSESITSFSTSSTWTYTTNTLTSSDYIYITFAGQRSQFPISYP